MDQKVLLPSLFRTEYRKMVAVLCGLFGIEHIETAEDIVSDTFLSAMESWSYGSIPENPTAWLYAVAKNKTKNYLKRSNLFHRKLLPALQQGVTSVTEEREPDLSKKNIDDSQLAMLFTVCDPAIAKEAQITLALNLLCGFGTEEIASAFLASKDVIYKRISRAKDKLRENGLQIRQPSLPEIDERLDTVIKTIYLVFSEGYYSVSHDTPLRRDFCEEAMRLADLLITNPATDMPVVHALMALMCFHASRLNARYDETDAMVSYKDQDRSLWDNALIEKGIYHLNRSSGGSHISRYHLEAGIAYWHTLKEDIAEKWENILQLYNELLILEYSPIAALNRTYALAMARSKQEAIIEAEKLQLTTHLFYHSLLGYLYTDIDNHVAIEHYKRALTVAITPTDRQTITNHIDSLKELMGL